MLIIEYSFVIDKVLSYFSYTVVGVSVVKRIDNAEKFNPDIVSLLVSELESAFGVFRR